MNRDLLIGGIGGSTILWARGQDIPFANRDPRPSAFSAAGPSRRRDIRRTLHTASQGRPANDGCDSWQPTMDKAPEAKTLSV